MAAYFNAPRCDTSPLKSAGLLAILLLSASVWSASAGLFNHPEIKWKSIETEHFVFHFYDNTEPLVAPAIAVAEEVYPALENLYGSIDYDKINIVLGDYDDLSNGFADWLGKGVEIWTPDLLFPFRGSPTWLRNVITHELTHIITLRKAPGLQMIAAGVSVGIHRPGFDLNLGKTLPMMKLFPSWFAEGLAQTGSTRCGNDCWDSRRDMVLRCACLDHSMLSLDQMGVFAYDQTGNELVYNQGFSLTMHIEKMVGSEELHRILKRSSGPWELAAASEAAPCEVFGGRDLDYYYRQWRDSLQNTARKATPVSGPTETSLIWQQGRMNQQPRIASGSGLRGWLTSDNDDSHRTDLVILRKGAAGPQLVLKHAETSWDFSAKGDFVYFVKSYDPGKHGSYLKELYRCAIGTGRVEQLTRGGRIYACAVSPDNDRVAVVRFRSGRFSFEMFDVSSGAFRIIDPGVPGNSIAALDFNPADPATLVAERIVDGRSALYGVEVTSGAWARISSGLAQEETPFWAKDGRIYFSADYDGIFNIYSIRPDGSDLLRHTSVIGGAFEPVLDADGTTLLFSEYTSSGFRIVQIALRGDAYAVPSRPQCYFKPLAAGASAPSFGEGMPYKLRMLRATWQSAMGLDYYNYGAGLQQTMAGIGFVRSQNDVLGKFNYFLGAGLNGGIISLNSGHSFMPGAGELFQYDASASLKRFHDVVDSGTGIGRGRGSVPFFRLPRLLKPVEANSAESPRQHAVQSQNIPFVAISPQCGIVSQNFGPTLSSVAQVSLFDLIPLALNSVSDISLQVGRDATIGASFLADVNLYKLMLGYFAESDTLARKSNDSLHAPRAGAAIPLWLSWQHAGYYNQDMQHNLNGLWQASLTITPSNIAGWNYRLIDTARDSSFLVKGISGRFDIMHGFPLTKYSGIPVALSFGFSRYGIPVNYTTLDTFPLGNNSDFYLHSRATVSCNFPIFRTIKSGRRLFFDALYGKLGYYFSATANRSFLVRLQDSGGEWMEIFKQNLNLPVSSQGFHTSHLLFFTAEVNNIAEFLFPGGMSFTGVTDIANGGSGVYISAQF